METGNIFQTGDFPLHTGGKSCFKIDCDALTGEDWETLAFLISRRITFGRVVGVPRGGTMLAMALGKYETRKKKDYTLIVDDVLMTGASMEAARSKVMGPSVGVVVFARRRCPFWVHPIFQMIEHFDLLTEMGGATKKA